MYNSSFMTFMSHKMNLPPSMHIKSVFYEGSFEKYDVHFIGHRQHLSCPYASTQWHNS